MKILTLLLLTLSLINPIQTLAVAVPPPPQIDATAYILQDYNSNQTLMENNADTRVEPASLTKLMTAYIVFKQLRAGKVKLTDKVRISEKSWRMPGSRMYVKVDTRVSVKQLLQGLIIQSGNDASVALAEFLAGTEEAFATLMNEQAKILGLNSTHYMNSTGLPDNEHYTTVRDLVRLSEALIDDFPEYYHWYSEKEFTYNKITQPNRNLLLGRDSSVDGLKTGHTKAAGYCLVASAKRGEMRLISVLVGAKSKRSRARETEKILDYGFRFFESHPLYKAKQPLDTESVWKGNKNKLQLGLSRALSVTVPKGQYKQLSAKLHIDKHIMAPVVAGKKYGTLKISLANKVILERPLVALYSVEVGNIWNRLVDSFLLFFVK
jgi:D-alanyl-D-alanine carboxypeptidase (penicillin-binding protein 5/6)